jgi:hypothetical protein
LHMRTPFSMELSSVYKLVLPSILPSWSALDSCTFGKPVNASVNRTQHWNPTTALEDEFKQFEPHKKNFILAEGM